MSIATPTRLDHVQALRGYAAGLVLATHLVPIANRSLGADVLPNMLEWGIVGVDLFFVLSGFIMVYVTRNRTRGGLRGLPEFAFARVTRIYPLYWVVSAALLLVTVLRPGLAFSGSSNEPQLLNSVFLTPAYAYPLLEVGWTLVYEVMFYVLFIGVLSGPLRWRPAILVGWAGLVLTGNLAGWQSWGATAFHLFSPFVLEFLAGSFTALIYLKIGGSVRLAAGLVGVGIAGFAVWFLSGLSLEAQWPRVLVLTGPLAALTLGAALLDRHGVGAPRWTVMLGDWSYALYLTHLLSLSVVAIAWPVLGLDVLPAPVFILVLIFVPIAVAGLTYRLIDGPLIALSRRARRRLFRPLASEVSASGSSASDATAGSTR